MKILIAEDEHIAHAILERMLRKDNHEVIGAENGRQALDQLIAHSAEIDLLITDIMMPVMDGLQLLKHVSEQFPLLPVIVLTAKEGRETVKQALKLGASDFLDKPIDHQALNEAIETIKADTAREQLKKNTQSSQSVRDAQSMLMRSSASPADLDPTLISYWFKPISDAGGDLFIFKRLDEYTYSLILADMAGHDVTSSYIAAQFKGLVSGLSDLLASPKRFLTALNGKLLDMNIERSHVCALCVVWNSQTGHIELANAGLPHPYLLYPNGQLNEIPIDGIPLGLFPDIISDRIELRLQPCERILLFSDGMDAQESNGTLRIAWPITRSVSPVSDALEALVEQLNLGEMDADDDMILVAIEEPPYPEDSRPPPLRTCLDVQIHSTINLVEPILQHLANFLGYRHGLSDESTEDLVYATREIIVNAIQHGNLCMPDKIVHILTIADDESHQITITIQDQGNGFDLSEILTHEAEASPLRERKRGIIGAAAFAQNIEVHGNQVTLQFNKMPAIDDSV